MTNVKALSPETFQGNKILKEELSFAYQILAHLGWDDHTYTHLSVRAADGHSFFIYPFGQLFYEVTPDSLLRVTFDNIVEEGAEYQFNETAYIIHGNIYKARPDIQAIFHIHTPEIAAVSSYQKGLLPISQWALHFYEKISYHTYNSLNLNNQQGATLVEDLGKNLTAFLRNHGSITCGRTIQEAMFYTYHLQKACETQCYAMNHINDFIMPPHDVCKQSVHDLLSFEKDLGKRDWLAWKRLVNYKKQQSKA